MILCEMEKDQYIVTNNAHQYKIKYPTTFAHLLGNPTPWCTSYKCWGIFQRVVRCLLGVEHVGRPGQACSGCRCKMRCKFGTIFNWEFCILKKVNGTFSKSITWKFHIVWFLSKTSFQTYLTLIHANSLKICRAHKIIKYKLLTC